MALQSKFKIVLTDDLLTVEILDQSASDNASRQSNQFNSIEKTEENSTPQVMKRPPVPTVNAIAASADVSSDDEEMEKCEEKQQVGGKRPSGTMNNLKHQRGSKGALPSPLGSANSFDMQVSQWKILGIYKLSKFQLKIPISNKTLCRSPTGEWKNWKSTQNRDPKKSSSTVKVIRLAHEKILLSKLSIFLWLHVGWKKSLVKSSGIFTCSYPLLKFF